MPLKPTLLGSITQLPMVLSLLLPKVFLAASALKKVPYFFPIGYFVEYFIIVVYNKVNFGEFYCKYNICILHQSDSSYLFQKTQSKSIFHTLVNHPSTLATLCTPALYSIPGEKRTQSLEFDMNKPVLAKYGKIGHTILLYLLSGVLVYLPMGLVCTNVYDFKGDPTNNQNAVEFDGVNPLRDWYIILGAYFGAPFVYCLFHAFYYNVSSQQSIISQFTLGPISLKCQRIIVHHDFHLSEYCQSIRTFAY